MRFDAPQRKADSNEMQLPLKRKTALVTGGVLAAAAMFATGAIIGYSINDSGDTPANGDSPSGGWSPFPSAGPPGSPTRPDINIGFPQLGSRSGSGGGFGAEQFARDGDAAMPYPGQYYCPAPVGNVLEGSVIDLAREGFAMNLLGEGFVLNGISVRAEGECDSEGRATNGHLVLDTSWTHSETGLDVWVTQRASDEPVASVRHLQGAQFWSGGYEYSTWVSPRWYYPMYDGGDTPAADIDVARWPAPEADPRTAEVLNEVIATLAPDIPAQCFYTEREGSWADLVAVGIGDPRGAIPSGFSESYFYMRTYSEPAAGCDGPVVQVPTGSNFSIGFSTSSGDGWLNISGWRSEPGMETYPGWLDDWSVSWTSGEWQLNVNGSRGSSGIGADTLTAIARAIDPSFSSQCFIQTRELQPGDLAGLGFRIPTAPDGYSIARQMLQVTDVPQGCDVGPNVGVPSYALYWLLTNDETTFEVNVNRWPGEDRGPETYGYISDYGMYWMSSNGDSFSIWASSRGVTGIPDRDAMIAIAQSLDPNLDVNTLQEEPSGPGIPRPVAEGANDPAFSSD
jgi:hypothetical protein